MAQLLAPEERETIVRFSKRPEDGLTLETFNEKAAKKLLRAGAELVYTHQRGQMQYWRMTMPVKWFKWPRPSSRKNISEEQRAAARERLKAARESKGNAD